MTKKEKVYRDALDNIASYPLPVYTYDGKQYVPLDNADWLRTVAKEALAAVSPGGPAPRA